MEDLTVRAITFWKAGLPKTGEPQRYMLNTSRDITVDGVKIEAVIKAIEVDYRDTYARVTVYVRVNGSQLDTPLFTHTTTDIVEIHHDALFPDGERILEYNRGLRK